MLLFTKCEADANGIISWLDSLALVRERTIPSERPPLVGEVNTNFCGWWVSRGQRDGSPRPYSLLYRSELVGLHDLITYLQFIIMIHMTIYVLSLDIVICRLSFN
jgi:hypothetical protein